MEIIIFLIFYVALIIPIGTYLFRVATFKKTFADPIFNRADRGIYRLTGINTEIEMNWKQYAISLLITNGIMILLGYAILRWQSVFPFNPNNIENMDSSLSFNTIISFMTNTNLQHYSGESGLSYFSQMAVIIFMMFTSASSGYAACIAFFRGLQGKSKTSVGNFYVDVVRITTRVLLPLSIIVGLFLVWQGVPQTLSSNLTITTIEGNLQDIALGPVASLESIKHIGTNGGGFFGANSSTPFENPTIWTNILEMYSMMVLPGSCVVVFGKMIAERKSEQTGNTSITKKHFGSEGKSIFIAMSILFVIGLGICYASELSGNPALEKIGLSQSMGSMEGKEVRFGVDASSLFTTVTTSFTTGSVNNMHDTLTPLGGLVPLLHMMLNLVFGGKGVGMMNMIIYAILTVFICSLMIGRTPEYLGKKIEGKEMKLTALCIIVHPLLILGFTALAVATSGGISGITNEGYHGLSQILYEFASSAANNGSGFEGLSDNSVFWNITTGIAMFFGRYVSIILQLAIAGSLIKKQFIDENVGTLKTNTMVFSLVLVLIVYIFAGLTFFPTLALGPIAEHLTLWS